MKSLVDGSLGVEREGGIDLSGDLAGNDLENLLAELDKEVVESGINLLLRGARALLGLSDSGIEESGVLGLLGGSENQGGVGGGILGLVLGHGSEVACLAKLVSIIGVMDVMLCSYIGGGQKLVERSLLT